MPDRAGQRDRRDGAQRRDDRLQRSLRRVLSVRCEARSDADSNGSEKPATSATPIAAPSPRAALQRSERNGRERRGRLDEARKRRRSPLRCRRTPAAPPRNRRARSRARLRRCAPRPRTKSRAGSARSSLRRAASPRDLRRTPRTRAARSAASAAAAATRRPLSLRERTERRQRADDRASQCHESRAVDADRERPGPHCHAASRSSGSCSPAGACAYGSSPRRASSPYAA